MSDEYILHFVMRPISSSLPKEIFSIGESELIENQKDNKIGVSKKISDSEKRRYLLEQFAIAEFRKLKNWNALDNFVHCQATLVKDGELDIEIRAIEKEISDNQQNAINRKKDDRSYIVLSILAVPAYIAISFLFGVWSIIPLIIGIIIVPAIVGLVIGVAKDSVFGIMAFVVAIVVFAVSINMSKLMGRDYFADIENRNEQNAEAEKRNELRKNGQIVIKKILDGEKLDSADLSSVGLENQ